MATIKNPITVVKGSEPTLITKSVTANGTYNASDDNADGYSSVSVNVPDMSVTDNQMKILIHLNSSSLSPNLNYSQQYANDVVVNWGDGSPTETSPKTGTDRYTFANLQHTYTTEGWYVISLTGTNGWVAIPSSGTSNHGCFLICGSNGSSLNNENSRVYQYTVEEIAVGNNVKKYGDLTSLSSLKKINRMVFDGSAIGGNTLLCIGEIDLTGAIDSTNSWMGCSSVKSVVIPNTITQFTQNAFRSCAMLSYVDMTGYSLVNGVLPVTFNANCFTGINSNAQIMFATEEIANVAKTTTNLTPYASKIHYVGEVTV